MDATAHYRNLVTLGRAEFLAAPAVVDVTVNRASDLYSALGGAGRA